MEKIKSTFAWTIVQIRDLGGRASDPWIDYGHMFGTKKEATAELKQFGMPQDFKVIKVEIRLAPTA